MARSTSQLKRKDRGPVAFDEAYLDTSALIAFLDKSDSYHLTFKRLFSSLPALVTSALVVAEGHGWFLRRYDRRRALEFLAFFELLPKVTVQEFDKGELAITRQILHKFSDQDLTLADAHGLAVMSARRTKICWSTDPHMGLTGVRLAIAASIN
jgi:predicted nucleic acid-binding protein